MPIFADVRRSGIKASKPTSASGGRVVGVERFGFEEGKVVDWAQVQVDRGGQELDRAAEQKSGRSCKTQGRKSSCKRGWKIIT